MTQLPFEAYQLLQLINVRTPKPHDQDSCSTSPRTSSQTLLFSHCREVPFILLYYILFEILGRHSFAYIYPFPYSHDLQRVIRFQILRQYIVFALLSLLMYDDRGNKPPLAEDVHFMLWRPHIFSLVVRSPQMRVFKYHVYMYTRIYFSSYSPRSRTSYRDKGDNKVRTLRSCTTDSHST